MCTPEKTITDEIRILQAYGMDYQANALKQNLQDKNWPKIYQLADNIETFAPDDNHHYYANVMANNIRIATKELEEKQ